MPDRGEEYPGVLPPEDLAELMPIEEPGTDLVSRTRRLLGLTLAVQWTAHDTDMTVTGVLTTADQFAHYVATGHKPKEK